MMADEEDRAISDVSSVTSDEDASTSEPELMVATRERRKTAGNRYSTTIGQEQAAAEEENDDVALLFAEEGEGDDEEYNSDEGDDDADMSSSDDNDDQGPNAAADDMDGEKELERQAKVDRQRKRKADLTLTTMAGIKKKKPRIDPTSLHRAPDRPKPSKRKERVSWLPDQEAAPGRISLRKQTIAHRETTHARLKENEKHRLKMKAIRERKEREREAEAPKEMTQKDRLAEAERIERKNAKSLNRWEAMERRRTEEQAAKLAALKERRLEGAVVTFYSTSHKYRGDKPERTSPGPLAAYMTGEPKKRGRKPKALLEQLAAAKQAQASQTIENSVNSNRGSTGEPDQRPVLPETSQSQAESVSTQSIDDSQPEGVKEQAISIPAAVSNTTPDSANPSDLQHNVSSEETPSRPEQQAAGEQDQPQLRVGNEDQIKELSEEPHAVDSNEAAPVEMEAMKLDNQEEMMLSENPIPHTDGDELASSTPNVVLEDVHIASDPQSQQSPMPVQVTQENGKNEQDHMDLQQNSQPQDIPFSTSAEPHSMTSDVKLPVSASANVAASQDEVHMQLPSTPLIEVISTRNLVILEKFDELSSNARHVFSVFYGTRKNARLSKHTAELCPITGLPVKYRDPDTGIGYANATAYKKLKDLRQHQFTWSGMLGCYVGRSGVAARGVPEGFLAT